MLCANQFELDEVVWDFAQIQGISKDGWSPTSLN